MLQILIVDPSEKFPEYDYQTWYCFAWKGTAIPLGNRVGEWAWVGRIDYERIMSGKRNQV
jgi:hypothetical protein